MPQTLINKDLITVRQLLHQQPALANEESGTARLIVDFFRGFETFKVVENVGGTGVLALCFLGEGPCIYFRAELDALPIQELNQFQYRSKYPHISHMCGHDGHMAILMGLAQSLIHNPVNFSGTVGFLFQPAEEIGAGAQQIMDDVRWPQYKPDFMLALHNLPGFALHHIITRGGVFSSASVGLKINIVGKTSHAAHPEKAVNPLYTAVELFDTITAAAQQFKPGSILATPIALNSGSETFGTSPPDAQLLFTLRSAENKILESFKSFCEGEIAVLGQREKISISYEYAESFSATENDPGLLKHLHMAAANLNLQVVQRAEPFRWSEDFGRFGADCKILLFGLGSGIDRPELHNPDYDFPDELLPTGIAVFREFLKTLADATN